MALYKFEYYYYYYLGNHAVIDRPPHTLPSLQYYTDPRAREIRTSSNNSHPLFAMVATHLLTSKAPKPEFGPSVLGVEPRTPCTVMHK